MLVPWERVSNVLELLHDSPSQGQLGIEKYTKGLVKGFNGMHEKEVISKKQQSNSDISTNSRDEFDFENNVNANSKILSYEEEKKVRSLFTKYEIKFLRSANDKEFCTRVYLEIKFKKDAVFFRRTFGSMSFEKTNSMKKVLKNWNEMI